MPQFKLGEIVHIADETTFREFAGYTGTVVKYQDDSELYLVTVGSVTYPYWEFELLKGAGREWQEAIPVVEDTMAYAVAQAKRPSLRVTCVDLQGNFGAQTVSDEQRAANLALLRDGVMDLKCIYAGAFDASLMPIPASGYADWNSWLNHDNGEEFGTLELYLDGEDRKSANVFIGVPNRIKYEFLKVRWV